VIPASPVRQAQQVRWAQPAQQAPLGRGGPRGLLEIPHKGEVASIGSLVDVLGEFRPFDRLVRGLTTGSWPLSKPCGLSSICKNITVVEFCFCTVAEMTGTVLDLGAITIRQTRD
jgi:hypothetical protein